MFSTDFIFRQQENLVDNQKCQAGFRPLCNATKYFFKAKKFDLHLKIAISTFGCVEKKTQMKWTQFF